MKVTHKGTSPINRFLDGSRSIRLVNFMNQVQKTNKLLGKFRGPNCFLANWVFRWCTYVTEKFVNANLIWKRFIYVTFIFLEAKKDQDLGSHPQREIGSEFFGQFNLTMIFESSIWRLWTLHRKPKASWSA